MRKFLFLAVACLGVAFSASAQSQSRQIDKFIDGKNAIGIKIGYIGGISYQRFMNDFNNRLEVDLNFGFFDGYDFDVRANYQWVWSLAKDVPGLNWYAGAGVSLGGYDKYFAVGAAGQIGIEYNFKFPLQLSIDWNPGIVFSKKVHFDTPIALGVRYRF